MKYWMTTHWPHERSAHADAPHNGVWVADKKWDVIVPMSADDLVWIYESERGRPIVRQKPSGETMIVHHHVGKGGIIALAKVVAAPAEDLESEPESYLNGSTIWWKWHADTRTVNSAGFIPREEVNELLGYKRTYPLRAFGTKNSGLRQIDEALHERILSRFLASHLEADEKCIMKAVGGRRGGGGGEGLVHKRLKDAIAADPEALLGEHGLSLVQEEYAFGATGDRVDVLLRDRYGRFAAVEVEPECAADHRAGPLQCVKYRALISYDFDRRLEEVRTFLVTHQLHDAVRAKAVKYGIECFRVSRS